MKSQKLVSIFTVILKLSLFVNIIMGIALITVAIHSTFSPTTYEKLEIKRNSYFFKHSCSSEISKNQIYSDSKSIENSGKEIYYFTKQDVATRISLVFSTLILLTFSLLVTRELLRFTSSLKNHQSMFLNSSKCFSRISIYLGIIFLFVFIASLIPLEIVSSFNEGGAIRTVSTKSFSFNVDFGLIVLLVFSLLLSAVFKEAERLRSENELTI